jgi:hypothetical protein
MNLSMYSGRDTVLDFTTVGAFEFDAFGVPRTPCFDVLDRGVDCTGRTECDECVYQGIR